MKMRHPHSCPVRRNFLSGIQVEFKQSAHQRSLRAQVNWLQVSTRSERAGTRTFPDSPCVTVAGVCVQVDNQLPGAIFPIVFHPVPLPKSIALDSGGRPPSSFSTPSLTTHSLTS